MVVPVNVVSKMADAVRELEESLLLEALFQLFGSDFRGYERARVAGRLSSFMQERGFRTISSLQDGAIHNRDVAADLLHALTFRPSGAFEEPQALGNLRALAEPLLRSYARPKVWVPECATAEEVFALAILLEEMGIYDRTSIHATCSNPALLNEIRMGRFPSERVHEYGNNYAASGGKESFSAYWSEKSGHAVFNPDLQRNITFSEYNLSTDTSFNEFHLIFFRNRLQEFAYPLRRRVLDLFADSLVRFGILFTDPLEELEFYPCANNYNAISREHGIYRRTYRVNSSGYVGALV
jgi:chemotaxis protein methyltransferase CheR